MESHSPVRDESLLLDYLPALYREGAFGAGASESTRFLGLFLLAFEKILLGRNDSIKLDDRTNHPLNREEERAGYAQQGLEEKIARLHLLFDAYTTPKEFLPWLAGWAALSLLPGLSEQRQRRLIASIIPLYQIRGTKKYLEVLLELYIGAVPRIEDTGLPPMQVGKCSTVGEDTCLGGSPPHFFWVTFAFPDASSPRLDSQRQLARRVIELAKPAHTHYELEIIFPQMQVGVHSKVGFDTVLGALS